jgi:hypothetical protein
VSTRCRATTSIDAYQSKQRVACCSPHGSLTLPLPPQRSARTPQRRQQARLDLADHLALSISGSTSTALLACPITRTSTPVATAATDADPPRSLCGEGRAYVLLARRFAGAPLERASFSSIAFVTNSITDVSAVTQCSFSARCSDFGIRVASGTTGSFPAMFHPPSPHNCIAGLVFQGTQRNHRP